MSGVEIVAIVLGAIENAETGKQTVRKITRSAAIGAAIVTSISLAKVAKEAVQYTNSISGSGPLKFTTRGGMVRELETFAMLATLVAGATILIVAIRAEAAIRRSIERHARKAIRLLS